MKYPNVNFPSDDRLWTEVFDFFQINGISFSKVSNASQKIEEKRKKILAPIEFSECVPEVLPYHFSFTIPVESFDFVVINLMQCRSIYTPFLKDVTRNYNLVFKNTLFVIYTSQNNIKTINSYTNKFLFQTLNLSSRKIFNKNKKYIKKIALVSANKMGNLGDDAVTWASYDSLKKVFPKAIINIYRPPVFRWQIFQADLLVLGGGGLFYDSCFYNAMNYTRYIAWAKEANIPSCALGIGTQGIKTELGKTLYKHILNFCEFVSVRDVKDAEILRKNVGVQTKLYVTQDMAFSLQRPAKKRKLLQREKKPIMLFSLIDTNAMRAAKKMQNYRQTATLILKEWQSRFDIWCIVQSEGDTPLYLEYLPKKRLIRIPFNNIGSAIAIYKQADLVLTSRFHGLIFSLLAQAPVIATGGRQGKIYRLIHNSIPSMKKSYIPITDFTEEIADQAAQELLNNKRKFTINPDKLSQCINNSLINESLLRYYRAYWEDQISQPDQPIPEEYH